LAAEGLGFLGRARLGGAEAPGGAGPVRITFAACDDMDMKLADDIAERGDIDLRRSRSPPSALRRQASFRRSSMVWSSGVRSKISLTSGPLRHQHQPGPATILHQAQLAQADLREEIAVA
jgi:hypothetical protein